MSMLSFSCALLGLLSRVDGHDVTVDHGHSTTGSRHHKVTVNLKHKHYISKIFLGDLVSALTAKIYMTKLNIY